MGLDSPLLAAWLLLLSVVAALHGNLLRKERHRDEREDAARRAAARMALGELPGESGAELGTPRTSAEVTRAWWWIGFGTLSVAVIAWALVGVLSEPRYPHVLWAIPYGIGALGALGLIAGSVAKIPRRGWIGARAPEE